MTNVEKIIQVFETDGEFQKAVLGCKSKNEAVDLLKEKVPGATNDEVQQAVRQKVESVQAEQEKFLQEEASLDSTDSSNTVTTATTVTTITAAASSYAFI